MAIEKPSRNCPSNFMKCVSYLGISFLDLIFFPGHSESNPFLSAWFCVNKFRSALFFLPLLPVFVDSFFFHPYTETIT